MSMEDIFEQFGDVFGGHNPFESFFGGARSGGGGRRVNRGSNLRIKIKLTLDEIVKGVEKTIKVNKLITCQSCSAIGRASCRERVYKKVEIQVDGETIKKKKKTKTS